MNLFEIDYFNRTLNLIKESFTFKKYKAMNPVLAILVGVTMIPFVVSGLVWFALTLILSGIFKIIKSPIDYLKDLTTSQGEKVHPATQFIIYFISWPLIFIFYVAYAAVVALINLSYAITSLEAFIWTLGGFKFHLLINDTEDIAIEVEGRYSFKLVLVYVCIAYVLLFAIPLIESVITYAVLYYNYQEQLFNFELIYSKYTAVFEIFSMLYVIIGFSSRPKQIEVKVEETIIEEEKE